MTITFNSKSEAKQFADWYSQFSNQEVIQIDSCIKNLYKLAGNITLRQAAIMIMAMSIKETK